MKNKLINKLCFVIITKNGPVSTLEDRPSWNEIGTTFDDTAVVVEAKRKSKPVNLPKWSDGYEWLDKLLPAAGTMIGGIIGGGMTSTAGNIVGGLGDLAAMVPGPVGAAGSAILKAGSGLANRAFGSKMNDANIAKVENNIKAMNAFTTNANNYDQLAANARNATQGMTFSNNFIGSDGWFSNKAKNKANSLRKQVAAGNNFVQNSLMNNANNIGKTQMQNLQANYAAYGGPIDGAIGYDFMQQSLLNDQQKINNQINRITSMPNSFINNEFALGGQRNGGYFSNGLTYIGEGGTHEQNPHEGVLMGYDEEGTPNLVEEGEYVWNDYVFSNRMKLPKDLNKIFKLGNKKGGYTFAEAVDFIQKESEERPNDPISARGLNQQLMKLAMVQEELRMQKAQQEQEVNKFDTGGPIIGDDGKESDWFKKNVIDWFNEDPYGRMYQYLATQKYNLNTNNLNDALSWALEKDDLAPYIKGEKSLDKLTDKEAESIIAKFSDGKYVKNSYHDIFGAWPKYMENDKAELYKEFYPTIEKDGIPIKIQKIDPKTGNVTSTPFTWGDDGKELVYPGHKYGLKNWLYKKDPETNTSIAERLTAMGYDVSKLDLEEQGGKYYINLSPSKNRKSRSSTDDLKTTYKVKTDNGYIDVDGKDLYENPEYKNYKKANTYTDDKGNITYYWDPITSEPSTNPISNFRFAPIAANLSGVITDIAGITNKPDYTESDMILRGLDSLQYPTFSPIGNRIKLDPLDINYFGNQLISNNESTKRQLLNQAGLNRGTAAANLLAADYNGQNAWGDLLLKKAQEDNKLKLQEATYNRETDMFNHENASKADMARAQVDQLKQTGIQQAMALHQTERQLMDTNKSNNISGLFNSLGDLGREQYAMDMINNNKALLYNQLGQYKDDLIQTGTGNKKLGGYLTIKNKRK